ncbi:hypothetical protein AB0M22_03235 [Nocardia sp. NPDC051756]|uniref:hypothetical protein n=1 Tax=Nocardia sp. NPDC051756 TaxID=3154751 RepID=UPI003434B6ED
MNASVDFAGWVVPTSEVVVAVQPTSNMSTDRAALNDSVGFVGVPRAGVGSRRGDVAVELPRRGTVLR